MLLSNEFLGPLFVAIIVMAACSVGFILVFAAIKIHTSRILYNNKRKSMINEENPQMEWDDSGLNITENPLDTLEVRLD
jgi:ABC-type transport system involved in multi-copper enzyme maturation permease subunit